MGRGTSVGEPILGGAGWGLSGSGARRKSGTKGKWDRSAPHGRGTGPGPVGDQPWDLKDTTPLRKEDARAPMVRSVPQDCSAQSHSRGWFLGSRWIKARVGGGGRGLRGWMTRVVFSGGGFYWGPGCQSVAQLWASKVGTRGSCTWPAWPALLTLPWGGPAPPS